MSADHIDDRIREALDGAQTYSPSGRQGEGQGRRGRRTADHPDVHD